MAEPEEPQGLVIQELLVRYLDTWTPAALHSAKRVTYAATGLDGSAVAALRVFGEFTDRLAGRRLAMVLASPSPETARTLGDRLAVVHAEIGGPAAITIHAVAAELVPALTGEGAFGSPLFVFVDGVAFPPTGADIATLGGNRATELLIVLDPATIDADTTEVLTRYRGLLRAAGLSSIVHSELVDITGSSRLILFATGNPKHIDTFKDELWAVDEYAGVRYRDPLDPAGALVDISLRPDLGPLRRMVLRLLAADGPRTVADLRRFAATQTAYRPADLNRLLSTLVTSGSVRRDPDKGRLTPDTVLTHQ